MQIKMGNFFRILGLDLKRIYRKNREESYIFLSSEFNYLNEKLWNILSKVTALLKTIVQSLSFVFVCFFPLNYQIALLILFSVAFLWKTKGTKWKSMTMSFHYIFINHALIVLINMTVLSLNILCKNIFVFGGIIAACVLLYLLREKTKVILHTVYLAVFIGGYAVFVLKALKGSKAELSIGIFVIVLAGVLMITLYKKLDKSYRIGSCLFIRLKQIGRRYLYGGMIYHLCPWFVCAVCILSIVINLLFDFRYVYYMKPVEIQLLILLFYVYLKMNVFTYQDIHMFFLSKLEGVEVKVSKNFYHNFVCTVFRNMINIAYMIVIYCSIAGCSVTNIGIGTVIAVVTCLLAVSSGIYINYTELELRMNPRPVNSYVNLLEVMYMLLFLGCGSLLLQLMLNGVNLISKYNILWKIGSWKKVVFIVCFITAIVYIIKVWGQLFYMKQQNKSE